MKKTINSGCFKKGSIPWNFDKKGIYTLKHSGQFKKGFTPWNKGKHPDYMQGENHPFFGKHHSEEFKQRLSLAKIGKHISLKTEFQKGNISLWRGQTKDTNSILMRISVKNSQRRGNQTSMWGRKHSKETKEKMRIARLQNPVKFLGASHHNWKGGISFEPYPLGWTKTFKEQIRYRDGYKCQLCSIPEIEHCGKLLIHHIDYNKDNLSSNNLLCLCRSCHAKTNFNKEYWIHYFRNLLLEVN